MIMERGARPDAPPNPKRGKGGRTTLAVIVAIGVGLAFGVGLGVGLGANGCGGHGSVTRLAQSWDSLSSTRQCLILLKNRSTKLRARYRYGLKQIGALRLHLGGILASAPFLAARALIQSAP